MSIGLSSPNPHGPNALPAEPTSHDDELMMGIGEPTSEQARGVNVGDVLAARINEIKSEKSDAYDDRQTIIGGATGLTMTVPLIALSATSSEAVSGPVSLGIAVAGMGFAAAPAIFGHDKSGERLMPKKSPVINGYTVELIYTKGYKHYPAAQKRACAAVLLPQPGQNATDTSAEDAKRLAETLYDAGADAVILPQSVAEAVYPDGVLAAEKGEPLNDLLEKIKPGMPLKAARTETGRQLFQVLEGDIIDDQRQTLSEIHELPYSPERQAKIEQLLAQVAQRTPLAQQTPEDEDYLAMPTTAAETQALADRLMPYAQQYLAAQADSAGGWYRMPHDPARQRKEFYALPIMFGDRYDPAVTVRMVHNVHGEPVQRVALQDYRPTSEQLATLLNKESLTAVDTVPVLAELLAELKQLDAYLQNPEYTQLDTVVEAPPLIGEVSYARSALRIALESDKPQQFRRRMAKMVGSAMLVGTIVGGGVSWATQDAEPASSSTVSGIGSDQATQPPQWRLESHNGADTAGYYEKARYNYLDIYQGGWTQVASTKDDRTILQPTGYQNSPYVTAAGYWESGNSRAQAGQQLNAWGQITLPVKRGTGIADIRVTAPDGQNVPFDAWTSEYDGSVKVKVDTNGRPAGEKERVEYDMIFAKDGGPMTIDMHINGVDLENTPALGKPSVADLASGVRNELSYDNTKRVQTIVKQSKSPEDLRQRTLAAGIANCNLAATVTAIEHEAVNPDEPLAYTDGYLVNPGERYIRNLHAWLTDKDNKVVDATPALKGRDSEDAGLPQLTDAELDAAWNDMTAQPGAPPDIPLTAIVGALAGVGLAGSLTRRAQYAVRSVRYGRADRNRYLSDAQAERVVSHAVYGGNTPAPELDDVAERLPVTMNALTREDLTAVMRHTTPAEGIGRKRLRDLRRFIRLRRAER